MKSNLSHILPVWKACRILGEPTVRRMLQTLLQLRTRGVPVTANVQGAPNNNNNNGEDSSSPSLDDMWEEELEQLVAALFYIPNQLPHGASPGSKVTIPTPPVVKQAWNKLTSHARVFGLDKQLLFRYVVPNVCHPHSGPHGHMGLFDCWVYTLQGHAPSSAATYYGGANSSMVWIPDVLIFLAICQDYHEKYYMKSPAAPSEDATVPPSGDGGKATNGSKKGEVSEGDNSDEDESADEDDDDDDDDDDNESSESDEEDLEKQQEEKKMRECLLTMAKLAFRFYDSYQKKGTLARDTLHRFLTDVYGEDSYKMMPMRQLLDVLFQPTEKTHLAASVAAAGPAVASTNLSESQFVQRIFETTPTLEAQRVIQKPHAPHISQGHVLLDWIALLGNSMVPPEELPQSTQAYLETMQVHPQPIVSQYQLAETRLYEIKRRFHSLVESSAVIFQGDPMIDATEDEGGDNNNTGDDNNNASSSDNGNTKVASTASAAPQVPKHVITQSAFEKAVTRPNVDMGHGGYLPKRLAHLVFKSVLLGGSSAAAVVVEEDSNNDEGDDDSGDNKSPKAYWGLYHVLKFGCEAVRCTKVPKSKKGKPKKRSAQELDMPLLKQVFYMFAQNPSLSNVKQPKDPLDGRLALDRKQIGTMLLLLLEHAEFRLKSDSPPQNDGDEYTLNNDEEPLVATDETQVSASACSLLGLLPPLEQPPAPTERVPLKMLVDHVLEEAKNGKVQKETLSLEEFIQWHYKGSGNYNKEDGGSSKHRFITPKRLGPLLLDLRLIASVLFGIPPIWGSLEVTLIAELQRRHKYRYPPTEVTRRGPKGTIWYIIDHTWFQSWAALVKRVANTAEDDVDKRGDPHSALSRGLPKINNTNLLAENGSLALRADIRWGHDYEILPPLAWSALQAWYDGGPPIHRMVVPYVPSSTPSPHSKKQPKIRTEMEMELYPFFVTVFLCDAASRGEARPFQQHVPVSRVSPVRVVLLRLAKGLNVDPDICRLWVMGTEQNSTDPSADIDWLLDLDKNIVEQRNHRKTTHPGAASASGEAGSISLLLELKDEESGMWPRGTDGSRRSYVENRAKRLDEPEMGDGVVGLYNMGNTCYMNTPIQCLSHTPIFREYFTSKAYLNDINSTNPLGYQGRLAQVSAVLINSLWKRFNNQGGTMSSYSPNQQRRVTAPGSYCPVSAPSLTPKSFKDSLGKFNENFSGNEQHDAQEFLAFLLDGLSEDLNRIVEKPYIEAPDSDGKLNDAELADIWWTNHLKREMSIIVALFTGQYKSLLTCRTCKYESARFEPFLYLQLPLPEDDNISVSVVLYPLSRGIEETRKSQPQADVFRYSVRVRNDGNLYDVLFALAKVLYADEVNRAAEQDKSGSERKKELNRLSSNDSEDIRTLEAIYHKKAANMAVVDMRDGYISKVASNAWSLPDLQNKETGELPVLHVYELDPVLEDPASGAPEHGELGQDADEIKPIKKKKIPIDNEADGDVDDETSQGSGEQTPPAPKPPKHSFLALAQRRSEVMSRDFLHPLSHRVFGTPLLLRVHDLEGFTGRDLYDLVANRLRNFVPKSALRFLEKDDDDRESESLSSYDKQSSNARKESIHGRQRLKRTTTDMEEVSAGPVPRYGFRLRITSRDGRRCTLCPWYECCIGCLVPDDEYPTIVMCGDSIAVDWHFAVDVATSGFGQRINSQLDQISATTGHSPRKVTPGVAIKNHSSMGTGPKKKGMAGAIALEDCLDAFAKEEKIPEAYCSKCKDFRVQTKRMSLWRLPPVVIIHLKRFQFTQHMRRKLRDLVVFPVEGLDLSSIVAADTALPTDAGIPSTPPRKQFKSTNKKARSNGSSSSSPYMEDDELQDDTSTTEATEPTMNSNGDGRSVMLYDLYGVVHHQGALSGGHYVASIKSEIDGQWRLYNDAQIFEIHSRDVVDSSAYILFYIRRDVKDARLSDYWDTTAREGEGLSEQDMDKLLQGQGTGGASERCVIS